MSATLSRGLTLLAITLLVGGAYRLNHAIVQENVLGLFPSPRPEAGLIAAAGGSAKQGLATTTAKKESGKGITGYIQDLLKLRKQAVTAEPPVTPEEPELPPEDPAPVDDTLDQSDPLAPVDEPVDELVDEELPPEEEEYLEDEYEDFFEEVPYEDYAEEYPYEEYTYEEWTVPPYDPAAYVDETAVPPAAEPALAPAPAATKPAVKKVLVPVAMAKKLPDLYVGEIAPVLTAGQTTIQVNGPIGFNLRIDNAGRAEAASFTTRVRVDAGADGSFDTEKLIAPQGPLPLNATQRLVASYVIERATPGRHMAEICVDSTNAVAESSERNNCRRVEFSVTGATTTSVVAPPGYKVYQSVINFLSGFLN